MIGRFIRNNDDLLLVSAVVAILLILFAPIPTGVLDFLLVLNFSFALTILMLTFYVARPVEFSTFPSLLLVATLFRLSLNVAATRLILTDGFAGDVIGSIGSFAVQGNYIIGMVVFFILIVVQFVVVTAGAQRVSEVAARFTLDAVPGQQMERWAEFLQGGKVAGREVVSIIPAAEVKDLQPGPDAEPRASAGSKVEMLKGNEYLRVWINRGGVHYLIHMPPAM